MDEADRNEPRMSANSVEHTNNDVRSIYEKELHDGLAQQIPMARLLLLDVLSRSQDEEACSQHDVEQIEAALFLLEEATKEITFLFSLVQTTRDEGSLFQSVKRYINSVAMAFHVSITFLGEGDDTI